MAYPGRHQAAEVEERRHEQVAGRRVATEPGHDVGELTVIRDEVDRRLGDRAGQQAVGGEAEDPRGRRAPLQSPCQGQRRPEVPGGDRRPQTRRDEACAEITPGRQRERGAGQQRGQCGDEQEHPPAVLVVGADLVAPAEGRGPRQPRRATPTVDGDIADRAQHERHRDHGEADAPRGAGTLRELSTDRPDAGEHDPRGGPRETHRERSGNGGVLADHPERDEHADDEARSARGHERGGQVGVPAHRRGSHQLPPAGLLLDPGVPDDDEHTDDRHDQHARRGPPEDQRAEAGRRFGP